MSVTQCKSRNFLRHNKILAQLFTISKNMKEKNTTLQERISAVIDHYANGINTRFSELTGVGEASIRTYLKGTLPKADFFEKVAASCDGLSIDWLITGEGTMLKQDAYQLLDKDKIIEDLFVDRLIEFFDHEGLNDNQVTVAAGLSVGLINKTRKTRSGMTSGNICKILKAYPQLSADWLLTGQGNMIKSDSAISHQSEQISSSELAVMISRSLDFIAENQREIQKTQEQIDILLRAINTNNQ